MQRFAFIQILWIVILLLASCGENTNGENTGGGLDSSDWPCWRGPDHNGISIATDWQPQKLDGEPRILWETEIGRGFSSIAVQEDYLLLHGE